jgi:hypothetical protein
MELPQRVLPTPLNRELSTVYVVTIIIRSLHGMSRYQTLARRASEGFVAIPLAGASG